MRTGSGYPPVRRRAGGAGRVGSGAREDLAVGHRDPARGLLGPAQPVLRELLERDVVRERRLLRLDGEVRGDAALGPQPAPPRAVGRGRVAPGARARDDAVEVEPGVLDPREEAAPG